MTNNSRVLGRRVFAVETVAARTCQEPGGKVSTRVWETRLGHPVLVNDGRRLQIVVDGLLLHGVGTVLGRGGDADGAAPRAARRRKERTYLELVRPGQRAKLVVLAGRWSEETASFRKKRTTGVAEKSGAGRGDFDGVRCWPVQLRVLALALHWRRG